MEDENTMQNPVSYWQLIWLNVLFLALYMKMP